MTSESSIPPAPEPTLPPSEADAKASGLGRRLVALDKQRRGSLLRDMAELHAAENEPE